MAMQQALVLPGTHRRSRRGLADASQRYLHQVLTEADQMEPTGTGVQLVSDGTAENTRVLLDGHPVNGVTDVTWRFSKSKNRVTLILELHEVKVDAGTEVPQDVLDAMAVIQQYNSLFTS